MINSPFSPIGLYIHIPFCIKKCPYCDFYSVAADEELMDLYTNSVCSYIKSWSKSIHNPIDTLYFGGGTPSLMGEIRLTKIIESVKKHFCLLNPEITIEINPTKGKNLDFNALKDSGINRISIGLQSSDSDELKILGRSHTPEDAKSTILLAQNAGITNISLDLMLAIPLQIEKSLLSSINFCKDTGATHISSYLLKLEESTPFFKNRYSLNLPDEDKTVSLYMLASKYLESIGYNQYEISNFSVSGKESKHNLKYWNCDEYLGIGPSAHSFINNERFYYKNSLFSFLNNEDPIIDSIGSSIEEYSMLRLRLKEGLIKSQFLKRFGTTIPNSYIKNANKYKNTDLLICDELGIRFTKKGFLVSNELISQIIL